jgi:hypothetical protein
MLSAVDSCQILIKIVFSRKISKKKFARFKLHENPSVRSRGCSMRTDTDRQTDMTKLILAFRNFAKAPKTQHFVDLFLPRPESKKKNERSSVYDCTVTS